jgi:hypothetical protein
MGADYFCNFLTPGLGEIVPFFNNTPLPIFPFEVYSKLPPPRFFRATHAAIAEGPEIIVSESETGTDSMIEQFIECKQNHACPIFYKFPLKESNPYFDIPVLGPKTVRLLAEASVKGIVVDSKYCYIDEKAVTLDLCRDKQIFLIGVDSHLLRRNLATIP